MDGHPGSPPLIGAGSWTESRLQAGSPSTRDFGTLSLPCPYYCASMGGTLRELTPSKRDGARRWELRVHVGRDPEQTLVDPDTGKVIKQGSPVHISRVFRGGKREAIKALDRLVSEAGQSRTIGSMATVGKLLSDYLSNLERLGKALSTMDTYRTHIEKHLRPGLGSIRLDRLTVHNVDRYLTDLDKVKALAPRTIKLDYAILSTALTQAVD